MAIREILATLTSRGQISVPVEVQRRLGLKPHDTLAFTIDSETGEVRLRRARFTLETAYQSVPALEQPLSDEDLSRIAKEDKAAHMLRELKAR